MPTLHGPSRLQRTGSERLLAQALLLSLLSSQNGLPNPTRALFIFPIAILPPFILCIDPHRYYTIPMMPQKLGLESSSASQIKPGVHTLPF